jgi:hypothetical protein
MGGACSTNGVKRKVIGKKARGKETTKKINM